MIDINLLPHKPAKRQGMASLLSVGDASLKLFVKKVSIILIIALFTGIAVYIAEGILLMRLEAKQKKIGPQSAHIQQIKSQSLTISADIVTLDNILQRENLWSKFLNDISDSIIPGVWLSELYVGNFVQSQGIPADSPDSLKIRGYAISISEEGPALIGRLIKSLKDNPGISKFFENARLSDIQKKQIKEIGIVDFVIECSLRGQKHPDEQREPKKQKEPKK